MAVINTVNEKVFGDNEIRALAFTRKSSSSLVRGELAGIYVSGSNRGLVDRFDDALNDMKFLGLVTNDTFGVDNNEVEVQIRGFNAGFAGNVSVAASASSKSGDPVFATDHQLSTLSAERTSATQEPVGRLYQQLEASSLIWKILFDAPAALSSGQVPVIGPKATLITADGAIPQTSYGFNGAYIPVTGGSSAQLTLADPVAGEIGNVIRIHRIAGSGTHDVDFNDESGTAVTVTLAAGDVVVLQAINTDGYRQIG